MTHQEKEQAQEKPAQVDKTDKVLLGPRPYNRFLGNPPFGMTPAEAFKQEYGYDWEVEISLQPVRDIINKLQEDNNSLKAQVEELEKKIKTLSTHTSNPTSTTSHKH